MARLTEEVRERLRAAAAKKKGRDTLMGLDRTLCGVALDYAMEQVDQFDKVNLRANGELRYNQYGPEYVYFSQIKTFYTESARSITNGRFGIRCPWVRLSYAPDYLKEELHNRFGSRRVQFEVRGEVTTAQVFPVAPVFFAFRFIWPRSEESDNDLRTRFRKYVSGYSEGYIQEWPGVGAKIKTHDQHPYAGVEGVVKKIQPGGGFTVDFEGVAETVEQCGPYSHRRVVVG